MIIDQFWKTNEGGHVTVSARLRWEQSDPPLKTLYFQTDHIFEKDLSPSPEAFLVASFLPAVHFGEKRIRVDGPVCPELLEGLSTAMALFHAWYGDRYRPIPIECSQFRQKSSLLSTSKPRASLFLSGGVDSLAVLRTNHLRLPIGHPDRFRDGIFIYGHDIGGTARHEAEDEAFMRAMHRLEKVASECDLTLIPIRTNTRHLFDDHQFWMRFFYSAALAAVGHTLSRRIDRLSISSGNVIQHLRPWGSHPVLDPCYSSATVQVRHAGLHHTRLDRVRWVSEWPAALSSLRVCGHNPARSLNCGACEKCLRTMTQLVAVGKLGETDAFPVKDISAGMIRRQLLMHDYQLAPYKDALPLLMKRDRYDLVHAIRRKIFIYNCIYRYLEGLDVKTMLKHVDRVLFQSRFLNHYRIRKQTGRSKANDPLPPGYRC
jgi:hypothetical protein